MSLVIVLLISLMGGLLAAAWKVGQCLLGEGHIMTIYDFPGPGYFLCDCCGMTTESLPFIKTTRWTIKRHVPKPAEFITLNVVQEMNPKRGLQLVKPILHES